MSFLLFCLFIILFIFILNYVLIVKFGIFIYYKIWILLNIYCFIWNYFVTCLEVFWSVMSSLISAGPPLSPDRTMLHCPLPSSPGSNARMSMHCYPIGCVIKSTHLCICSCSPIVNFLKFTFYHGMVTSVIYLIKNNLNRHIEHENLLSIYENVDYFQIMSITNLEWFCINCSMIW